MAYPQTQAPSHLGGGGSQHLKKMLTFGAFFQMFVCGITSPEIRRLPRIGKACSEESEDFCEEHWVYTHINFKSVA